MKSPPQYLIAIRLPSCDVTLPQGQSTSANLPILVSGHSIDIVKFGFPECEGITVILERQPSVNWVIYMYYYIDHTIYYVAGKFCNELNLVVWWISQSTANINCYV